MGRGRFPRRSLPAARARFTSPPPVDPPSQYGYFFTEYHVGTPPQKFQPVIDTGST